MKRILMEDIEISSDELSFSIKFGDYFISVDENGNEILYKALKFHKEKSKTYINFERKNIGWKAKEETGYMNISVGEFIDGIGSKYFSSDDRGRII